MQADGASLYESRDFTRSLAVGLQSRLPDTFLCCSHLHILRKVPSRPPQINRLLGRTSPELVRL